MSLMKGKSQLIQEAIEALRAKDENRAREILGRAVRDNPQNDKAWMYSAFVVDTPQQSLYCLQRAVEINPANSKAWEMISRLEEKIQAKTPQSPPVSPGSIQEPSKPIAESQARPLKQPSLEKKQAEQPGQFEATKECPYCAETIKAEAIVCRYCGRDLWEEEPGQDVEARNRQVAMTKQQYSELVKATQQTAESSRETSQALGCIVCIIVIIIGVVILAATLPGNPYYGCGSIFLPVILVMMRLILS